MYLFGTGTGELQHYPYDFNAYFTISLSFDQKSNDWYHGLRGNKKLKQNSWPCSKELRTEQSKISHRVFNLEMKCRGIEAIWLHATTQILKVLTKVPKGMAIFKPESSFEKQLQNKLIVYSCNLKISINSLILWSKI